MAPTVTGRFCDSCQKTVVDFTGMTDQQVIKAMAQQTDSTCGRFWSGQLSRPLLPHSPTLTALGRLPGILIAGLLGLPAAQAQPGGPTINQVAVAVHSAQEHSGGWSASNTTQSINPVDSSRVVTGRVRDAKDGSYLSSAFIAIKNTSFGANTDTLGYFRLKIPADYARNDVVVSVGQVGFITQEITIKTGEKNELSIMLQEDTAALGEVIVTGYYKKMSFWQRLRNRLRVGR
jgi:hypothetical protein